MKKTFVAVMVLTGTFIGAGFASGQEIMQYFGIFGNLAICGIVISCILMGIFVYCVADNIMWMGEREYVKTLCNHKWIKTVLNCYMLIMLSAMITAFGESLEQLWSIPKIYGVLAIDIATCMVLYFGAEGVIRLNSIVTPLIMAGIVFSLFVCRYNEVMSYNNFVSSAVAYTSYNVISMPFVMAGLGNAFKRKRDNAFCSVIFGSVIFALAFCMLMILKCADTGVSIPLLSAVDEKYSVAIIFILALSMITTAVSNGYGFVQNIRINKNLVILFLCLFGAAFSMLDFCYIVGNMYRMFGFVGIYIIIKNFYIFMKNREKMQKTEKKAFKLK